LLKKGSGRDPSIGVRVTLSASFSVEWAAQGLPGGRHRPIQVAMLQVIQPPVLVCDNRGVQRRERPPERQLAQLRDQRVEQQRTKVKVQVEVQLRIQVPTHVPTYVAMRLMIRPPLRPTELRRVLRSALREIRPTFGRAVRAAVCGARVVRGRAAISRGRRSATSGWPV
jgi:hypothetical protein